MDRRPFHTQGTQGITAFPPDLSPSDEDVFLMARPDRSPEDAVRCLLIQPRFQASNFWNLTESAATTGAKTVAPPLGLLTVAALLPQHWTFVPAA